MATSITQGGQAAPGAKVGGQVGRSLALGVGVRYDVDVYPAPTLEHPQPPATQAAPPSLQYCFQKLSTGRGTPQTTLEKGPTLPTRSTPAIAIA